MRAISMVRTSRTVIDATTSSRLSFSLTLLCRMSRICTAGPPSCLGLGYAPDAMLPGVDPRSEQARTIHELRNRLQVDPRRGVGRGGRLRGPALDRPGPTVVWQSRLAVKLMARRPPTAGSVPVVLDLEQRKRAQDVRRVRGRRGMQIGAVEIGKLADPEQAETALHLILQELEQPHHPGLP